MPADPIRPTRNERRPEASRRSQGVELGVPHVRSRHRVGSDVVGEAPSRAQWRSIGTLLSDLHDWRESCQDRDLAVAGHAMTVRPFLAAMADRLEPPQFGPISMALFQRSVDALTVAALPASFPQRELAAQLLRDP
jgi:hypothetical protein